MGLTQMTPRHATLHTVLLPAAKCPECDYIAHGDVEVLGLGEAVKALERMTPQQRRRALAYLNDRYTTKETTQP